MAGINHNRNNEIYNLAKSGKSYAEISRQYGLTNSRVREICMRIERERCKVHLDKITADTNISDISNDVLSVRSKNALINSGCAKVKDFYELAMTKNGLLSLQSTPNLGNRSLYELFSGDLAKRFLPDWHTWVGCDDIISRDVDVDFEKIKSRILTVDILLDEMMKEIGNGVEFEVMGLKFAVVECKCSIEGDVNLKARLIGKS